MQRTHSVEGIDVTARDDGEGVVLDAVIGEDGCVHPRSALIMARSLRVGALVIDGGRLLVRARVSDAARERDVAGYLASVVAAVRATFMRVRPEAAIACFGFWNH